MITSPSGSSCTPWPNISSNFTSFCACSTLWKEKQQKLISYVRGNHCTWFRDGIQHPSGPGWSRDKTCTIMKFSLKVDAILELSHILDKVHSIFEGQMTWRHEKDTSDFSALHQCPKFTEEMSITCFFSLSIRNHIFPNMAYLFRPRQVQCCLQTTYIQIQSLDRSEILWIVMTWELSIAWKLKDLSHAGWWYQAQPKLCYLLLNSKENKVLTSSCIALLNSLSSLSRISAYLLHSLDIFRQKCNKMNN